MTVLSQARKITYQGNGVASSFSFSFVVYASTDLVVTKLGVDGVETVLSEGAGTGNYSVSVASYPGSGSITFPASGASKLAVGEAITIKRVLTLEQATDLDNQGGYFPDVQETALDKLVIIDLQQQEEIDRSIKFPISDSSSLSTEFPVAAQRANKLAAFDAAGEPTVFDVGSIGAITLPLSVAQGGTASTTQQAALNALAGATTSGQYLRGNGTNVAMSAIQAADVPTLNQNTTGTAANITGTLAVGNGGTGKTTLAANNVLLGNGTSAVQEVAPGASGNVLTSNGSTWQSTAATGVPTGAIFDFGGYTAPSGYLLCDGSAVSRTTYASLWSALSAQATVTITIASPGVVTWNSHPLQNGDPVRLQTTGALPTGIAANTTYYVVSAGANTFQLAATRGGAAINTSGTQSGTHTAIYAPHGWGDNSTTFNVPDFRGRVAAGRDNMGGTAANRLTTAGAGIAGVNLGDAGGAQTVTLTTTEMPAHTHTNGFSITGGSANTVGCGSMNPTANTGSTGGGGAHQNTQPTIVTNKIIKT